KMDLDLESSSYSRSFERELILSNFETFQEMDHYYKKWAEKQYDSDMQKHEYNGPKKVVEKFLELDLDKDTRILDLLGGTGLVAELLKEQGYNNIDGLDGSQDMLEEAKNKGVYRDITVCYVGKGVKIPIEDVGRECGQSSLFIPSNQAAVCLSARCPYSRPHLAKREGEFSKLRRKGLRAFGGCLPPLSLYTSMNRADGQGGGRSDRLSCLSFRPVEKRGRVLEGRVAVASLLGPGTLPAKSYI
ncbi:unnamed protein product, partial [Cyprideis torosa]